MKILVLNCGSSSIKYKLYNMDDQSVMAAGGIESEDTQRLVSDELHPEVADLDVG